MYRLCRWELLVFIVAGLTHAGAEGDVTSRVGVVARRCGNRGRDQREHGRRSYPLLHVEATALSRSGSGGLAEVPSSIPHLPRPNMIIRLQYAVLTNSTLSLRSGEVMQPLFSCY